MATLAKLEPVDCIDGLAAAGNCPSTRPSAPSTIESAAATVSCLRRSRVMERSAESSVDIVRGPLVGGLGKHHFGGARLHHAAGPVLLGQEEGAVVGHPLGLLHVVGDD